MVNKTVKTLIVSCIAMSFLASCSNDDNAAIAEQVEQLELNGDYIIGVESTTGTDVLVNNADIDQTDITPINNGIAQPAWMTFYKSGETILSAGYSNANEIRGYRITEDKKFLKNIGNIVTNKGVYALGDADENTLIAIGLDRAGYSQREIYTIDLKTMSITQTVKTNWDDRKEDKLITFPTDIAIRDNKAFISYYLLDGEGKFSTPDSNQARVAVYSYPDFTFEKLIKDDRTSDLGRYLSQNVLEQDENGDIYTFASSGLANGFFPTPTNPGGILRIKKGETSFDSNYFFNIWAKSAGYKINDFSYVGNGKAIARVFQEDPALINEETKSPLFLWATYAPTAARGICKIAILDLYNETFKLVDDVPAHAGSWSFAHLKDGNKVYINTSDANGSNIYIVDVENATATKGSKIVGNYAKGIFSLKK